MPATEAPFLAGLPRTLRDYLAGPCGLPPGVLEPRGEQELPAPARRLLAHDHDMTSTLARHHGGELAVDVLRQELGGETYLREVFLRVRSGVSVVEYGVIAIALPNLPAAVRTAVLGARGPLGGLLHQFAVPFQCAPAGFFEVSSALLPRLGAVEGPCHGRCARLSTPAGESLAWAVEILPPFPSSTQP